jgi:hypothetical protein
MRGVHGVIVAEGVTSGFEVDNEVWHDYVYKVCYRAKATAGSVESP